MTTRTRSRCDDDTGLQSALVTEIRGELARQRITHTALAQHLNYTPQGLSRLMTGQGNITINHLAAIANVLDMRPDLLLARAHSICNEQPEAGA